MIYQCCWQTIKVIFSVIFLSLKCISHLLNYIKCQWLRRCHIFWSFSKMLVLKTVFSCSWCSSFFSSSDNCTRRGANVSSVNLLAKNQCLYSVNSFWHIFKLPFFSQQVCFCVASCCAPLI